MSNEPVNVDSYISLIVDIVIYGLVGIVKLLESEIIEYSLKVIFFEPPVLS